MPQHFIFIPELAMNQQNLADLIRDDSIFNFHNVSNDYSQQNVNIISTYWDEIFTTSLTDDALISNFFRFRLALNRPSPELDYYPNTLRQHYTLIQFVTSILRHFYNHQTLLINFSPALILNSHDDADPTRRTFLYASTNFLCLRATVRPQF